MLEIGCTYTDLSTMPYDEAVDLLDAHTGRKLAESQRMDQARKEAERTNGTSGGSVRRLPERAYTDPSYWDTSTWGDVSQWGKAQMQASGTEHVIWRAQGAVSLPTPADDGELEMPPEFGLPPE